ncbi:penicillin-binding protein 2 [Microbacterium sp. LRZ72]|uniref:peptidoglycan D,D-transpeptidase FtsI family protein n=1 Tax=Microbacterium sp. LRZ72 TaxID=2942481 RepID=UPI0029B34AB3|nr:penicillin-binding protein 2 [Microbacterium sp. LRZ72]MDX2376256.1 penicillin-binding protein 2 [Microbacterium sp. LRZ72]
MNKELRRLSVVVLAMFLALFVATSWIQVVQVDTLADDPRNTRALYDSYQVQRGAIIADGSAIAYSTPSDDVYSFQRVYAEGAMWAPVTGYINPMLGAATGLEAAMNQELSGTSGSAFLQRVEQIVTGQKPQGSNVVTSLDPAVQRAAFEALGDLQGAVIAIEPSTGRVLAMASSPSFDANLLAAHDASQVEEVYEALEADPLDPLSNRAIAGDLNPPGSTFKLVVASAALASGEYTPDSTFDNPARWELPGSSNTISNADGGTCGPGDTVTLADALRLSCNIPMAQLAVELGDTAIREEAERYGFNFSFVMPLVSTPSSYPRALDDAQTALTGFGQGQVTATPLQMAMVSAGIANGGSVMNPRMVDRVIGPDLSVQQSFEDEEFQRALSEEDAATMTEMMVANVSEGIASGARIDGVDVAGKTGTAENGTDDPYTLWFTGFAPADDPQVAVAVVIEDGGGLGQSGQSNRIAAPIGKAVMEAVLER